MQRTYEALQRNVLLPGTAFFTTASAWLPILTCATPWHSMVVKLPAQSQSHPLVLRVYTLLQMRMWQSLATQPKTHLYAHLLMCCLARMHA